jgi:cation diffusion facilitator CzcD-associated flavoprotein CzcO
MTSVAAEQDQELDARIETAGHWLAALQQALERGDGEALRSLFAGPATWRDLVSFTWSVRNWEGPAAIAAALDAHRAVGATGFRLAVTRPPVAVPDESGTAFLAYFNFETKAGTGSGLVQLAMADGRWVAATLLTQLDELRDHPWAVGENRPIGRVNGTVMGREDPGEGRAAAAEFADRNPDAIVVGAGHNGLMIAARLERLGVDTLVITREKRVGDNWRMRYPSVALHNSVMVNEFPYLAFPESFPTYLGRDDFADFMEYYAHAMGLKVWGGCTVERAEYDETSGLWEVTVTRADGSQRTVTAPDLVMATGLNGEPSIPSFPGTDEFAGTFVHSEKFSGGAEWAGKKSVVIGAGVSGHDIAQDLYEHGGDVCLLQRSGTCVVDVDTFHRYYFPAYLVPGRDVEAVDMASRAVALGVLLERGVFRQLTDLMRADDRELLDALAARGFTLDFRPNGGGIPEGHYAGRDSYYLDVGASPLIADGKIGLRSGVTVDRFTADGVILTNGEHLTADLVVAATGYEPMMDSTRKIVGDEVADTVGPIWRWGTDKEISGVYRRTAQPGLWFMTGIIVEARYYSKFLALQIKAARCGLTGRDD